MRLTLTLIVFLAGCAGSGAAPCSPSTCAGCCDSTGICQTGQTDAVCGLGGAACGTCDPIHVCTAGVCTSRFNPDGGSGGGGGGSGGSGGGNGGRSGGSGGGTGIGTGGGGIVPITSVCAGTTFPCGYDCIDPSTDESNCGACGVKCAAGLVCNRGTCETLPADCVVKPCPGDFGCNPQTRTCQLQCFSDADCRGGGKCTAGRCQCDGFYQVQCGELCVSSGTTDGSCRCDSGYEGRGECVDVDECTRGLSTCGANATCHNTPGRFTCTCNAGYLMENGVCIVDRCASSNGGCSPNATCQQYSSQVYCQCKPGYEGDGMTCSPVCYPGGACADTTLACYPVSQYSGRCERPGTGGPGAPCTANTDCVSGTRCERMTGAVGGFCATLCASGSSTLCSSTEQCASHDSAYVCLVRDGQPCDALRQNCAGSDACVPTSMGDVCSYAAGKAVGQVCTYANDCVPGAACITDPSSGNGYCRTMCDRNAPACPGGASCNPLTGRTYGVCI